MADILSQTEIDQLLSSLSSGEVSLDQELSPDENRKVRDYDFKMPKKLTKEQIKILMGIHENFARQLSSYFSGILRAYSQISVISIEEQHYYEYNNALPDIILTGVFDANPIEGLMLVDISNTITFNLVERLLGGGIKESGIIPDREFTEIEISLMERIFKQIGVFTKEAWSGLVQVEASLKQIESNARLIQAVAMDEIVVIIVMDVCIGNVKGTINFCVPCINIEPLIDKLRQGRYFPKKTLDSAQEETIRESMMTNIKESVLEVRAVFGETILPLREILDLQLGDVIKFDQDVGNVRISINDEIWFNGIPGIKKNKKAIKVSKVLRKRGSLSNGE